MGSDLVRQLAERLADDLQTWRPGAKLLGLEPLLGGESSLTFRASLTGAMTDALVVKAAVPGVAPVRNRDVLRQARLMRALAVNSDVPVPEVFFESPGDPPEVPPLFTMSLARGSTFEPHTDEAVELPFPEVIRARALAATAVLARLHSFELPPSLAAEAPAIDLREEIARWHKALSTVEATLVTGYDAAGARLLATAPPDQLPTLIHGDFRLGNILFDEESMNAVIDWEIWARADPRVDLGWFLLTADPDVHPAAIRDCPGMPRPSELLERYAKAVGSDVPDMDWFRAFTLFKYAAIVALIVKHRRKLSSIDDEFTARVAPQIPSMIEACLANMV